MKTLPLWGTVTPLSFRATTRNPAFKLFSKLLTVFGIVMVFAVSVWSTNTYYKLERSFTTNHAGQKLTSFNITGDFNVTGASVQCAVSAGNQCTTNPSSTFTVKTKHIKDLPASFSNLNSASATLEIPTGATIKWAGLLWQGHIHGLKSDIGNPSNANAIPNAVKNAGINYDSVKFRTPDGIDHTIDIDHTDSNVTNHFSLEENDEYRFFYQGFKDVTDIVKNSYSPTSKIFTVGDIQSTDGDVRVMKDPIDNWDQEKWSIGNHGNWSLVVVFEEPSYAFQNVSVYDGFKIMKVITSGDFTTPMNIPIHIDGFYTPASGTVNSKLMFYAGGGNKSAARDSFEILNANTGNMDQLTNGVNPSDNVFNDTFSYFGTNVNSTYHHLMDIDTFDISSKMKNSQSETDINLFVQYNNGADIAFVGLVAFSTELYKPEICYYEDVYKGGVKLTTGAQVNKGDMLNVKVYATNKGDATAENIKVYRTFDTLLPYVEDSTRLDNNNPTYLGAYTMTDQTDIVDTDTFDYNSSDKKFQIRIGTDATAASGGDLIKNQGAAFDYNLTMNSEQNTSISYEVAYTNTAINFDYVGQIGKCVDFNNTFWGYRAPVPSSPQVDIVDGYSGSGANYQSWITTKVSAKPAITLTAVYLGNDSTNRVPQQYTPDGNQQQAASITILYKLADMSGGATCANAPTVDLTTTLGGNTRVVSIIDPGDVNATSTAFVMGYVSSGMTPLVKKDIRVKYKAVDFNQLILNSGITCAQKSSTGGVVEGIPSCLIAQPNDDSLHTNQAITNYKTIFGQTAYDNCYTLNGQPCAASNGGVGNSPYDHEYGCFECSIGAMPYTCSNDNFAIRPNQFSINSTNTAFPNLLRSAQDYNLSVYAYDYGVTSGTNGSDDYNITGATSIFDLNTTKYNKNGDINASMYGTAVWSAYDFNMSDGVSWSNAAVGSEVAGTKFDDVGKINLQVVDSNWSTVDIDNSNDPTPHDCSANGAYLCGDKNVTYIPHHFDFYDLNITNNNGNPGSFTYIANEFTQMGGRIHTTMRSLNADGNVTKNFAAFPLWENSITVVPVADVNTTGIPKYKYPAANETTINNLEIGFADGNKTVAWDESNASQYLRFNFQREVNLPENQFDVNGSDLNMSITSHYVDPEDGDTADINGTRNGTAQGTAKFVYGRIIPRDVRVFGNVAFVANAWYEAYNTPTLNGASLAASKIDAMWYVNNVHMDANDGDGNVTVIIPTTPLTLPTHSSSTAGMETYQFSAIPLADIPYSGKAHINTDPWLWYGINALNYADPVNSTNLDCLTHPCFNITVVPSIGATGSAKSTNESTKASKKTDSGGGTWKSTRDYAPAIR